MKSKLKKAAKIAGQGAGALALGVAVGVILANAFEITVAGILDGKAA